MSGISLQSPDLDRLAALDTEALAVLVIPADKHYVAVARTAAVHVAGIMGLPISRTTDLRLAVDEACGLFLHRGAAAAGATSRLTVSFTRFEQTLQIRVSGPAPERQLLDDDLGWTLLRALCGVEVEWEQDDMTATLTLTEPLPAQPKI
jgi:anti-sigma regulatory factor (Ser/Thr protein kinase)